MSFTEPTLKTNETPKNLDVLNLDLKIEQAKRKVGARVAAWFVGKLSGGAHEGVTQEIQDLHAQRRALVHKEKLGKPGVPSATPTTEPVPPRPSTQVGPRKVEPIVVKDEEPLPPRLNLGRAEVKSPTPPPPRPSARF